MADGALATPPADLEAKVLEAVTASTAPATRTSLFSRRRASRKTTAKPRALPAGPWLPGLAGAAAVVALVLALTISSNTGPLDETLTTVAAAFTAEAGTVQTTRDGNAVQSATTAASLAGSSDAASGGPTTNPTDVAGMTLAALQPAGPLLENEGEMASGLATASAPAYFFFDTTEGDLITQKQADAVASRLTSATGLRLMDQSLSSDVKAFAAFVPREDSPAVVHLLYTIGASLDLSVCLSLNPGNEVTSWANGMIKDKRALAELSASPAAASGWTYTTSTASVTTEGAATTVTSVMLDEAGTHVLVVIFMAVQE